MRSARLFSPYRFRAPLCELSTAELLVICVLRLWAAPLRDPNAPRHDWREGLRAAGIAPDGVPAFDAFLGIMESATLRPLDVRDLRDPAVATDEASLLEVLAALQQNRDSEAMLLLARWSPPGLELL